MTRRKPSTTGNRIVDTVITHLEFLGESKEELLELVTGVSWALDLVHFRPELGELVYQALLEGRAKAAACPPPVLERMNAIRIDVFAHQLSRTLKEEPDVPRGRSKRSHSRGRKWPAPVDPPEEPGGAGCVVG